jgi:hypothetical protein
MEVLNRQVPPHESRSSLATHLYRHKPNNHQPRPSNQDRIILLPRTLNYQTKPQPQLIIMANNNDSNNNMSQPSTNQPAATGVNTLDLEAAIQRAVKRALCKALQSLIDVILKDLEENEEPSGEGNVPPMPDLSNDEQLDFLF